MLIQAGFKISFTCQQRTPVLLMVSVHPSRAGSLVGSEQIYVTPRGRLHHYLDLFGNKVTRALMESGETTFEASILVEDSGKPDEVALNAAQVPVEDLPDSVLLYLLASRYCDTEMLTPLAWSLFGNMAPGWPRVQAICDYVHDRLLFGYQHARPTRTASEGHQEQVGVCRDFAHLAVALCRCMNIPARYCTGYLGDIGVPADPAPMDFSAWFEVFLGGKWYTFDARHNVPRIGRIVIARGRDAADVAISTAFGPSVLTHFSVSTFEVVDAAGVEMEQLKQAGRNH